MSVFDNILSKTKSATQTVGKKANDLVEVTKLNLEISDRQNHIDKTFRQIGELIYGQYRDEGMVDSRVANLCAAIEGEYASIDSLQDKVNELKQIKICKACEEENPAASSFCGKCGTRLEDYPTRDTEDKKEEADPIEGEAEEKPNTEEKSGTEE